MTHELLVASARLADAATVASASPTAEGLPVGNLQTLDPGDACGFTDGADAHVTADLGSAAAVNFVGALAVVGAAAADTLRVRAATSEANLTAAPGYDSGASAIWPRAGLEEIAFVHAGRYLAPAQSFRWWRLDFAFAAGRLDVGRLMIDTAYVSPKAVDIGYAINWRDSTELLVGQTGAAFPVPGEIWREPEYSLNAQSEAAIYGAWTTLRRKLGRARDCFAWMKPGDLTYALERQVHGLVAEQEEVNRLKAGFYQARIRFRELLPGPGQGLI